ncbi:MAG: Na+/H+ antiporter NhaA [Legionellaceae bacterium]|nr:Na+/H+ antiporter NhaA [Legionellaceae bacterium]
MPDHYQYHTLFEKKIDNVVSPFEIFVDTQTIAGLLLIACIFLSLLLTNITSISDYYSNIVHLQFKLTISSHSIKFTLKEFVNEFLLLFFFLVLGLEIKRELIVGELAHIKRATVVIIAAIGGIIFPLFFYIAINSNSPEYLKGWAIPTATDTAIAIGLMSMFKNKLPKGIFPFLTAVAVIDDIVAITIIAVFYGDSLQQTYLLYALIIYILMISANLGGIRNFWVYLLSGFLLWVLFEKSGIHGAIAGALIALVVPARPKLHPGNFIKNIKKLVRRFEDEHDKTQHILKKEQGHAILEQVTLETEKASVPLTRWEFILEKPVLFLILPLFALTNGGIILDTSMVTDALHSSIFWGVFVGLIFGKPMGIIFCTYMGLKIGIGELPSNVSLRDLIPISLMAGIGYTMAIFIANLAFYNESIINIAKFSIVMSSIVVGLLASLTIAMLQKSPSSTR